MPAWLVDWALSVAPRAVTLHDRSGHARRCAVRATTSSSVPARTASTSSITGPASAAGRPWPTCATASPSCDALAQHRLRDVDVPARRTSTRGSRTATRWRSCSRARRSRSSSSPTSVDGLLDALEMAEAVAGGAEALRRAPVRGLLRQRHPRPRPQRGLAATSCCSWPSAACRRIWIPVTSGGHHRPGDDGRQRRPEQRRRSWSASCCRSSCERARPSWSPASAATPSTCGRWWTRTPSPTTAGMAEALAHHYGLPMFSLAGGSDAKRRGRAGGGGGRAHAAPRRRSPAATSPTTAGYLESGLTGSLAQLAICDEIVAWIRPLLAPVEIDDETLALDLIHEARPRRLVPGDRPHHRPLPRALVPGAHRALQLPGLAGARRQDARRARRRPRRFDPGVPRARSRSSPRSPPPSMPSSSAPRRQPPSAAPPAPIPDPGRAP